MSPNGVEAARKSQLSVSFIPCNRIVKPAISNATAIGYIVNSKYLAVGLL